MIIDYHRIDYPNGETRYFPLLNIELYIPGFPIYQTVALVDSGAETSLFSLDILEDLGVDVSDCDRCRAHGVGKASFEVARYQIKAKVLGKTITLDAHWKHDHGNFNLLGRNDFFRRFIVTFNERKHFMDISVY